MINVETYIKVGEDFLTVDEPGVKIVDPYYIEGAIELDVDGVVLFHKGMWDLVDQLWDYVVQGLEATKQGKTYSGGFPDQPLELEFIPLYGEMIKISVGKGQNTVVVDRNEFTQSILRSVQPFLSFVASKAPGNRDSCDYTLERLKALI